MSIAAFAFSVDVLSKTWAIQNVKGKLVTAIPGVLHMILMQNPGGSFGISNSYFNFALCFPALLGAAAVGWIFQRERRGAPITHFEELGVGLYLGGMVGNFCDRVLYGSVTDFLHLSFLDFCIFNVADVLIDCGFTIFVISLAVRYLRPGTIKKENDLGDASIAEN